MPDFLSRAASLLAVALLLVIGLAGLRRRLKDVVDRQAFTQQFLQNLRSFIGSQGSDGFTYSWLTERSARMQEELGAWGFLQGFSRPFENLVFSNAPVIITLLPELYDELNRGGLTGGNQPAIARYEQTLQEVLVRQLGILDRLGLERRSELRNPFVWFREGVRSVVFLPISLLGWLGITSVSVVRRLTSSVFAGVLAGVLSLLGLVSAVVTIVVGWEPFLAKLQGLFR